MLLQIAGIERHPPAVGGLHLGRDHGVGMDLRIVGTRRRLAEHRHRQTLRVRMQPAAVTADPRRRPEPLQMRQRRGDGDIVGLQEPVVARQRPAHRTGLRRRERRIKPRHRLDHPPISSDAIDERIAERCPHSRVTALQHGLQVVAPDLARQSETSGLAARPDPRHLARGAGQVSGVVLRRRPSRRRTDRRHPQHQIRHPIAHTGTCLQNPIGRTPTTSSNTTTYSPGSSRSCSTGPARRPDDGRLRPPGRRPAERERVTASGSTTAGAGIVAG